MNTTTPIRTQFPVELYACSALFQWHATSETTDGQYALAYITVRPGGEPPLHVHAREDELFFVLEGSATFQRGVERVEVAAGESVFLPRGIQHGFKITSDQARLIVVITPGGLEQAFKDCSTPSDLEPGADAPIMDGPPAPEKIAALIAAHEKCGIQFVGPPVA